MSMSRHSAAGPMPEDRAAGPAGRVTRLAALRAAVARIEGEPVHRLEEPGAAASGRRVAQMQPLGVPEADRALAGGFPTRGLTELHVEETRGGGTGVGFALALAVLLADSRPALWIGETRAFREAGLPYLPGLAGFGLDPSRLVLVRARRLADAAWAGEEAARSRALSLIVLEVRGNPALLSLDGTRRLHVRACEAGVPLLLLRQHGQPQATAAPLRLRIRPGPAATVPDLADQAKLLGHPVFDVAVEKARDGRLQRFRLEWNPHERRFQALDRREPHAGAVPHPALHRPGAARAAGALLALHRA
ncbi:ImuA family protein [Mangrovibrevibacter kandeliae]|uniref:ImuA family protein n=1 Tax=Mangrovibrevibacter kandeliae TaxID=2968473 RepID=UPI0021198C7A|nr:hypothetical protein [Aurantimonas sp. CSK15Z-1]MCQ8783585.1 hypothetical protein [Aurantimonas sp. CSK15Z-1]